MNAIFDFNAFLQRKRLKHREVAEQIGASMGLIGSWASNKALPSYEKIGKLIECGMSANELFGKNCLINFCIIQKANLMARQKRILLLELKRL